MDNKIVDSLRQFLADVKAGKPMRQSVVRRMKVKGKTVFTREVFTAPVKPAPPAAEGKR